MRIHLAGLSFAAAVLAATSSFAADLPARTYTKAPAPVYAAPIYNWTGFYIGAHIGAAFGNNGELAGVSSSDEAAFLGGGQIGADYQFSPNWLIGIEGQFSALSNNDRTFAGPTGTVVDSTDWLASVTGRLGYTWGPGLLYVKGGVAFRDNGGLAVYNLAGTGLAFASNRDQTGYTVGAGLEYMFAPAWSAKVEYQYYNFGTTDLVSPVVVGSYDSDIHTVKVGLNYHFNWGGPVANY